MSDTPAPPYVQFEIRAEEDREATVAAGHYVAKDVIYALVTPSGSRDRVEKIATDWLENLAEGVRQDRVPPQWLEAYKFAYKSFCENQETPEIGTSIRDCALFSPAQVKSCLDANIRTVEQMAEATEEALGYIGMGARALKARCQAWLDSSAGTGKLASELESLRMKNKELQERDQQREAEFKTMKAQIEALQKAK